MKTLKRTITLGSLLLLSAGALSACGGGADVDHVTARQAVESNTRGAIKNVSDSIQFLEDSTLFEEGVAQVAPSETVCATPTGPGGDTNCAPEPADPVDLGLEDESEELIEILNTYIFADGNVELEEGDRVVYLIRGSVACKDVAANDGKSECVDSFAQAQIRLDVTSPEEGDIDIQILMGADRHNPLTLQLHRSMVSAEVDLAAVKASANLIASIAGESIELPKTMVGVFKSELRKEAAKKFSVSTSVSKAINVDDGDIGIKLGVSQPVWSVTVDGAGKIVSTNQNMGSLDISFPNEEERFDEQTGEFTEIAYQVAAHLDGLTGKIRFDANTETVTFDNVSLGDSGSTLSVDGHKAFTMDLNAMLGRAFSGSLTKTTDGVKVDVDPGMQLKMVFDMMAVRDKIDVDENLLDEILEISLTGNNPSVELIDNGLKVLSGTLTLKSKAASITHTAEANQCVLDIDMTTEPAEPGDEPVEPVAAPHPFEQLEVNSCQ